MDGVAERVRQLRLERELTLQQLGQRAGLSASFLSQLERGDSSVSLAALEGICKGLDITLSRFFEGVGSVVPPELNSPTHAAVSSRNVVVNLTDGAIKYRFISHDTPGKLEVMVGRFTADDQLPVSSHEGEEYGYVLEGTLQLTLGAETHVLNRGNSYHFPAASPHQYTAIGKKEVVVLWLKLIEG